MTELIEKTHTVEYFKFEDGTEIRASKMLTFLEELEGRKLFPLRWERKYEDCADYLISQDIVHKNIRGSWRLSDEVARRELLEELREVRYG